MINQRVIDSLTESLPYLINFKKEIFVIKIGGEIAVGQALEHILDQIIFLKKVGIYPILIHGGGSEISYYMKKMSYDYQFVNGVRVTDDKAMEIVQMVLCGKINKDIVAKIIAKKEMAVGISGVDGNFIKAKKILDENGVNFSRVGKIEEVNTDFIKKFLEDFIPIVSSVAISDEGETLNINADNMAVEIGAALQAKKILFVTETNGVLKDINDKESVINKIKINQISEMITNQSIKEGMIPKLLSCKKAVESGVEKVHILGAKVKNSILLELFTNDGVGTLIL